MLNFISRALLASLILVAAIATWVILMVITAITGLLLWMPTLVQIICVPIAVYVVFKQLKLAYSLVKGDING